MKTLILMRHGKAEDSIEDKTRALNSRGMRQVAEIAEKLAEERIRPELIVCSDARRAIETARIAYETLDVIKPIKIDETLYDGGVRDYMRSIDAAALGVETLLVVAHNPTISDLGALIGEDFTEIMTPAAALVLEFEGAITEGGGKRLFYLQAE